MTLSLWPGCEFYRDSATDTPLILARFEHHALSENPPTNVERRQKVDKSMTVHIHWLQRILLFYTKLHRKFKKCLDFFLTVWSFLQQWWKDKPLFMLLQSAEAK